MRLPVAICAWRKGVALSVDYVLVTTLLALVDAGA